MSKRRVELGLEEAALVFAALGDETRLALLWQLSDTGPASISALAEKHRISRQAISKHLQWLAVAGLIDGRRAGREHVWALNPARLAAARRNLKLMVNEWDGARGHRPGNR